MKGNVPSLNTPFDRSGAVDYKALRRLVNHTVESGCGGMLALAVAAEHTHLQIDEKTRYIETVTDENAGRIPLVISVTAPDPATSMDLAARARTAGASGICVQLPTYRHRADALRFLETLQECGPDLLMVQDLDWAADGLAVEDIVFLFKRVDKFTWLKIETTRAGPKYSAVLDATGGALRVCGGWAVTQLMDALGRGVNAFIPTGMERVYVAIHRLYETGDHAGARALFERVLPILTFSNQHIDISIRFFKALRKAEGVFETDHCRIATSLDPVQKHEADHAMKAALTLMDEVRDQPLP